MTQLSWWQRVKAFFKRPQNPDLPGPTEVKDGVWYRREPSGDYLIGIDASVFEEIGKITFADFPTNQNEIKAGDELLDIEGDKSVETLKAPLTGTVISRNHEINHNLDKLNAEDSATSWIMELAPHD